MRDGQRVALEIETGRSDAAANVRKCLAASVDKVVVAATSAKGEDAIKRLVPEHPQVSCLACENVARVFSPDLAGSEAGTSWTLARRPAN